MNFGFLIFPDVEELDFIGPWEIIGMWGKYYNGPEQRILVSQTGEVVQCAKGLKVVPDCRFDNCASLDYLLIPGGQGTRKEVENTELLAFVKKQAAICQQVLSVCTGAFILQATGLLENKNATTHWGSLGRLRQQSGVTVIEQRFVRDGNIWTAAGVSAGIDLALALIAEQAGEDIAGKVQLAAEYYPSPMRYGKAHLVPEAPAYLKLEPHQE
jgi:transcriptional regulator GlxA family with amidase domain